MATSPASRLVTPPVRLMFPELFRAAPVMKDKNKMRFQATLLIPPSVDMKPFHEAVKAAMLADWGAVQRISGRSSPFKRCDDQEKQYNGMAPGWVMIRTNSKFAPHVVDQKRQDILEEDRIFAGCWCRFAIHAFTWDDPERGVSFGLDAVQLIREDTRLDGRKGPEDLFEEVAVDDDVAPPFDEVDAPAPKAAAGKSAQQRPAAKPPADDIEDLFG